MHDTGCSGLVHWDDPEGWDREVGEEFKMRNTCTCMADSCQCMAKPIPYCKVKKNNNNKKILKKRKSVVCQNLFIHLLT